MSEGCLNGTRKVLLLYCFVLLLLSCFIHGFAFSVETLHFLRLRKGELPVQAGTVSLSILTGQPFLAATYQKPGGVVGGANNSRWRELCLASSMAAALRFSTGKCLVAFS